jgi:hypothetical protein
MRYNSHTLTGVIMSVWLSAYVFAVILSKKGDLGILLLLYSKDTNSKNLFNGKVFLKVFMDNPVNLYFQM